MSYEVVLFTDEGPIVIHSHEDASPNKLHNTKVNQTGDVPTFNFTIYNDNPGFDKVRDRKSLVRVIDKTTGEIEFDGRIAKRSESTDDNVSNRTITAEDMIAVLQDTMQKPLNYTGSPSGFLEIILERHNELVLEMDEPHKQFIPGQCNIDSYTIYTDKLETINKELNINDKATIKPDATYIYSDWTMNKLKMANWIKGTSLSVDDKKEVNGMMRYKLSRMVNGQKIVEGFVNAEDIIETNWSNEVIEVDAQDVPKAVSTGTKVKLKPNVDIYFASSDGTGAKTIPNEYRTKTYTIGKYVEAYNRYSIVDGTTTIAWVDEVDLQHVDGSELKIKKERIPVGTRCRIKPSVTHYYNHSKLGNNHKVKIPDKWKNRNYTIGSYSSMYNSYTIVYDGIHIAWMPEQDIDFSTSVRAQSKQRRTTVAIKKERIIEAELDYNVTTYDALMKFLVEPFNADVTWELNAGVRELSIFDRIWNETDYRIEPTLNMIRMQQDFDASQIFTAIIPIGTKAIEITETTETVERTEAVPTEDNSGSPLTTINDKYEKAVQRALSQVGGRYVYGGQAYRANDCSGLVLESFRYAGFKIDHRCTTATIAAQQSPFKKISRSEARRGDLAITRGGGHVEILLGTPDSGAGVVHAASPSLGIITQKNHVAPLVGYYRVMDLSSGGGTQTTKSLFNYYPTIPRESQLNHMYASPYGYSSHRGIDIVYNTNNSNIYAVDSGRVTQVQKNCVEGNVSCGGGWGNHVIIRHENGYHTVYAHLRSVNVNTGDTVNGGQLIGLMGNTGNSTGKHLHLEVLASDGVTKLNPNKMWDWSEYKSLFNRWWL